ncbi:MAG: elongation factor P, partial [bacterium]
ERKMQFLYLEGEHHVFMDTENFEQIHVSSEVVGSAKDYLKEGEICTLLMNESEVLSLELPNFITLKVVETDPGAKGDTVSGSGKPATLETGAVVTVPFFIEIGELIRVDIRTNTYLERVKE